MGLIIGIIHAALPMAEYNEIICKVLILLSLFDKLEQLPVNFQSLNEVKEIFSTNFC